MIITVTGKPCSGKGAASKILCEKYGFDYLCAGDIMRDIAMQCGYNNILEFQQHHKDIKQVDNYIDSKIEQIGITRANDDLLIDSRLAWHFVKKSFKVFIDVDLDTASKRLLSADRQNEQATSIEHAKKLLIDRWQTENDRYTAIYNTNNLNMDNYDLVIDSTNLTQQQIADKIYKEYKKFLKKSK